VLIQGFVGPQEYDENACAVFSSSFGQEAYELIPFKHACRVISRCRSGGYKMFCFYYEQLELDRDLGSLRSSSSVLPTESPSGIASPAAEPPSGFSPVQIDNLAAPSNATQAAEEICEGLECAVCLDVLCEPLQLPCSHSFCRACLQCTTHPRCPLCRAQHPEGFNAATAPVHERLEEQLLRRYPEAYAQRIAEAAEAAMKMFTIRVGNRHELVANPKMTRNGKHLNKHKWCAFVELQSDRAWKDYSTNFFVEKVLFKLAPCYTVWPAHDKRSVRVGKNPEVRSAPFEVTRIGWGYFDIDVVITWKSWLQMEPLEVNHLLSFDGEGDHSNHTIDMGDAFARAASMPPNAGSAEAASRRQHRQRSQSRSRVSGDSRQTRSVSRSSGVPAS